MKNRRQPSGFIRAIKKFFLSAFVVITFAAYALENRGAGAATLPDATGTAGSQPSNTTALPTPSNRGVSQGPPAQPAPSATPLTQQVAPAAAPSVIPSNVPTSVPTNVPTSPSTAVPQTGQNGQYKDGTYTGPVVFVYYGDVQVQAVVQNGKLSDVKVLQYPIDRRTSQRINAVAVPMLQQEAVQAQSANINIITGATLTSEGFYQSLQTALNQAQ